ncbi:MAG: phosphoserine phosphatase [Candidatus Thermoplasmatota archaeon]
MELIEELEEKRKILNAKAEEHKAKRDEYNEKTKRLIAKRDELNENVRKNMIEANHHRELRNKLNEEVRSMKEKRDEANRKANALENKVELIKKQKLPKDGPPLNKLKKELKNLEFKQMTSVLSADKEKGIVTMLAKLHQQIREIEKVLEKDEDVMKAVMEAEEAKAIAEEYHKKVSELAEKAQQEHDLMAKLLEEGDNLRREADKTQEEFLQTKLLADEEHRQHLALIRQVHDFDKIIAGLRRREKKKKKGIDQTIAKKQADEILEKFKRGEKLSTEDLMILQMKGG